ncbi:MAG: N-acetylneuraminate synthase [Chloroflexi bacterium]|nr:N-acetylneuraminate synthase [Chloroflexota bacterium]
MQDKFLNFEGRKIGYGQPCFIIAEAGVNHNGDLARARQMIEVAVSCGVDAIKFQTFKTERLAVAEAPKATYQMEATDRQESQTEMLGRLELSPDSFRILQTDCKNQGIIFMSTPFDEESADLLNEFGMAVFKIASGEITNLPFLAHLARKGKPIILSTGMSYLSEVDEAVRVIRGVGNPSLAILQCTSNYPAKPADIHLRAMDTMQKAFNVPVGFSDHSEGIEIPLAAVALGANIIEKHFTISRSLPGPDHQASLEPDELKQLVDGIRKVESAMGDSWKQPVASEANTAMIARKSLASKCDIPKGTVITDAHLTVLRPGTGISPSMYSFILGRRARIDIPDRALISLEMLE